MRKISLLLFTLIFYSSVFASSDDGSDAVRAAVKRIMPNVSPDSVTPAPVPGLYEVIIGAKVLYISKDGKYLIEGDVFDLVKMKNLTETKRTRGRLKAVSNIEEDTMIVFSPEKVKHSITVFTDIDCGYCRKMHREMDDYMAEGIEIRYLAYPRSGINTPSYFKATGVWCADDRKQALTDAKNGGKVIKTKTGCKHPVKDHMAVAEVVGVTGTPTLVFEDGQVIPGYLPAKRLIKFLDSKGKR
jgi:thiol:disulfide interchange protein DsbC